MDLLPRQYEDFRKKEYWDDFFQQRQKKAFEWYGEYDQVRRLIYEQLNLLQLSGATSIAQRIKAMMRVLVVGCGNSELTAQLYEDGFTNITSIDFSERVIQEMSEKYPHMQWKVMDMTRMDAFEHGSFDLVVDKGALDALMAADTSEIRADALRMFEEIERVLCPGGRYICVTMAQDFILDHLLTYLCLVMENHWDVSIAEIPRDARQPFVPFFLSCLKRSKDEEEKANSAKVMYNQKSLCRKNGAAQKQWLVHEVEATQWYTMTQAALKKIQVGRQEVIELISHKQDDLPNEDGHAQSVDRVAPRFILRLVDVSMRGTNGSCAVFLIPQGREHEWMFATEEGAAELAQGAGFSRLILVALGRGHTFESTAQVQEELNSKILELAPNTMNSTERIPYLTIEEGIGKRNIIHRGHSDLSGELFIEEVYDQNELLRRLVFLSNTNVIQSEVRLLPTSASTLSNKKKANKKKKNKKKTITSAAGSNAVVDTSYLAFDYHKGMIAVLHASCFSTKQEQDTAHESLLIGLGGGCLAKYMHDNISHANVTACELDPTIIEVAETYFGFQQDERMKVIVGDGLKYVAKTAGEAAGSFDSIIVDVDAKERSVGMSCPPVAFVEEEFLKSTHQLLRPGGILLINVSCRSAALYQDVLERLKRVFSEGNNGQATVFELQASEQDVNRVVFVSKCAKQAGTTLLKHLREQGKKAKANDTLEYVDEELCELMRDIKIAKE